MLMRPCVLTLAGLLAAACTSSSEPAATASNASGGGQPSAGGRSSHTAGNGGAAGTTPPPPQGGAGGAGIVGVAIATELVTVTVPQEAALSRPRAMVPLELPPYQVALLYGDREFDPAGNRIDPFIVRPESLDTFTEEHRAVSMLLKKRQGGYFAVVPIASETAHGAIVRRGAEFHVLLDSGGSLPVHGDFSLFATGDDESPYAALAGAWKLALSQSDYGRLREDKAYYEPFSYLGWCSWEGYHKSISEQLMLHAIDTFKTRQLPVRWVLIDDGHSLGADGVGPNSKFPNGYSAIRAAMQGTDVTWLGLWYASFGKQKVGMNFPADLGQYEADVISKLNASFGLAPKPEQAALHNWWQYFMERGASEADFLKVDFVRHIYNSYAERTEPELAHGLTTNATQVSAWYRKEMEETLHQAGKGLLNCNANNYPNPFLSRYSNASRVSRDYKKNNLASAAYHLYLSYHNALWVGHVHWTDHDMFHSSDTAAGSAMAVSKAMSGGPAYLSDLPEEAVGENIWPLVYRDGRLLRPLAPAVPGIESLFDTHQNSVRAYKTLVPVTEDSVAVHLLNLEVLPTSLAATITADDYRYADGMRQPYPGLRELPAEGLVLYDVLNKNGERLDGAREVSVSAPLEQRLYQLSAIRDGWAFLGRSDKFLSAASGKVTKRSATSMTVKLVEQGPIAVYSEQGPPALAGATFTDVGNGIYLADLAIRDGAVIEITR